MARHTKANAEKFEKETGKKAKWQGKQTAAYKKWLKGDSGKATPKKGKTQGGKRRDFGGRSKEDWFKLHPESEGGMSSAQAKKLAKKLRDDGNAVVLDPLGGGKKMGVYYRPSKRKK